MVVFTYQLTFILSLLCSVPKNATLIIEKDIQGCVSHVMFSDHRFWQVEDKMRKGYLVCMVMLAVVLFCRAVPVEAALEASQGEQAFVKQCAVCHPKGGNIINPTKTLDNKALAANGIREPADIVGKMRSPGPAMTRFDEKTIPDGMAKTIAEYILKTFK
jgi:cytochrome c6